MTLVKVLSKATQNDPKERHQNVTEFWQDLSGIRKLADAEDKEDFSTVSERPHQIPQPHISKGYTPLAPQQPRFNTSKDFKVNPNLTAKNNLPLVVRLENDYHVPVKQPPIIEPDQQHKQEVIAPAQPKIQRRFPRRLAAFLIFIGLFAGILYGTHNYLRGRGILPQIHNPFANQTGTANGDVYLRRTPNTDNAPVGLVTKNSRLKIFGSSEDWYEVDIIEQGNPASAADSAKHGWVNGKYINIDD